MSKLLKDLNMEVPDEKGYLLESEVISLSWYKEIFDFTIEIRCKRVGNNYLVTTVLSPERTGIVELDIIMIIEVDKDDNIIKGIISRIFAENEMSDLCDLLKFDEDKNGYIIPDINIYKKCHNKVTQLCNHDFSLWS